MVQDVKELMDCVVVKREKHEWSQNATRLSYDRELRCVLAVSIGFVKETDNLSKWSSFDAEEWEKGIEKVKV